MKKFLGRLWRFFQSRRLALILLAIITVAVITASLLPQTGQMPPDAHTAWRILHPWLSQALELMLLDRVYSSWWFYLVAGLLLANTLVCTLSRIPALMRGKQWPWLEEAQIKNLKTWRNFETSVPIAKTIDAIDKNLSAKGYRVVKQIVEEKHLIFARKGELAHWGSLLFHFSFLVILVGVVLVQLTRYAGTMVITEGQTVTEQRLDYLRTGPVPPLGAKHEDFQLTLARFTPTYYQGTIGTDYAADLVISEAGKQVKRQTVRVNQPLTYKGVSFVLELYGIAPLFELKDSEGREMFSAYVNLRVLNQGSKDVFTIPERDLTVWVSFYPDMVEQDGQVTSRSLMLLNPVLYLEVSNSSDKLFGGLLPLKGEVTVGQDTLRFDGLRYWTQYKVVRDRGKEILFAGLWLGVLGLAVRYLITPRQVWGIAQTTDNGSRLTIGCNTAETGLLFSEELDSLLKGVGKGINDDFS